MNKQKGFMQFSFLLMLLAGLVSCRSDKPEDVPQPIQVSGNKGAVYIINEGNFQFGNAMVSYYDAATGTVSEDLFQPVNSKPLGDVCQSMYLHNGKAYIVVNNSGKIEVVDARSFVSIATINGFQSPRYFLPVSNSKAYVTDYRSNTISILDLTNNSISGTIPCNGWTEAMVLSYGKVFVTNMNSDKVYLINTLTDVLEDSITVSYASNSLKEDKNGKLWVLCGGDQQKNIQGGLHRINPVNRQKEYSLSFSSSAESPWRLVFNASNDTLYYLNKGLFRMPVNSNSLPVAAFISQGNANFYAIGISPADGIIYVSDAVDYVQKGVVYRYRPDGVLVNSFKAGIIPCGFYFN